MVRFGILVLGCCLSLNAWAVSVETVVGAVEAKYKTVKTIKASFTQVVTSEIFGEEKTHGDLVISRPSKMRWQFKGDSPKDFITDGQTLWLFSPSDNTVYKYDDVSAAAGEASFIFDSLGSLDEKYVVSVIEGPQVMVSLVPKADKKMKSFVLGFDENYGLTLVKFEDNYGTTTEISLTNLVLDAPVAKELFEFTPPAGVDVISAGGM